MNNIWMYWEGEQPEHIRLCIESVKKRKGNLNFYLLNSTTIKDFLPNLRPEWHQLRRSAHKADYIRIRLVYEYGGMWIDCDMVALAEISPLFDFPEKYDYACQSIATSIGCFIARPKSKILKLVMEEQDKILDQENNFEWNDIGNNILKKYGLNYPYYKWQEWVLDEIAGGKVSKLFSRDENIDQNVSQNAVLFHLCNETISHDLKFRLREGRILTSKMLISKIFRKSFDLKECNSVDNQFINDLLDYNFLSKAKQVIKKLFNRLSPKTAND